MDNSRKSIRTYKEWLKCPIGREMSFRGMKRGLWRIRHDSNRHLSDQLKRKNNERRCPVNSQLSLVPSLGERHKKAFPAAEGRSQLKTGRADTRGCETHSKVYSCTFQVEWSLPLMTRTEM